MSWAFLGFLGWSTVIAIDRWNVVMPKSLGCKIKAVDAPTIKLRISRLQFASGLLLGCYLICDLTA